MLIFHTRLAGVVLLLFVGIVLLVRLQPDDDHALRSLLLPENCPMPCFMGIRPGLTTVDEALQLLRHSGWVDQISTTSSTLVQWRWNGHQPAFIDLVKPASFTFSDTVNDLTISTQLPVGSLMLVLHEPGAFMVTSGLALPDAARTHDVSLRYLDILLKGGITCPARIRDVIYQQAAVTFYNHNQANFDFEEQFWRSGRWISFSTNRVSCG